MLHGYATQAYSWYPYRKDPHRQVYLMGRRFDHGFASALLNPVSCTYLQAYRESALSDYGAVEIVFRPSARHWQGTVRRVRDWGALTFTGSYTP
jgi:exonuclease III